MRQIQNHEIIEQAKSRSEQLIRISLPEEENSFKNFDQIRLEFADYVSNNLPTSVYLKYSETHINKSTLIEQLIAPLWGEYTALRKARKS